MTSSSFSPFRPYVKIQNRRHPTSASIFAVLCLIAWVTFVSTIILVSMLASWVRSVERSSPKAPNLTRWQEQLPQSSQVLARDGTIIHNIPFEVDGETGFRTLVDIESVPMHLVQAILAAEDQRFIHHRGADLRAIVRAAWANRQRGKVVEGGSTITQQVARNLLPKALGSERSVERKLREVFVARKIEANHSKSEILDAYLNLPFLGDLSWGFGAAAERYFGVHVSDVTISQAALLAGLIRSPSHLNPRQNLEGATTMRNKVLANMLTLRWIDQKSYEQALQEPVHLTELQSYEELASPWHTSFSLAQVQSRYPEDYKLGGLSIVTTIDIASHRNIMNRVEQWKAPEDNGDTAQLAYSAIDHRTGYLQAMVGGTRWQASQFNRLTDACRQPGSAIKPLLYASALAYGEIHAATPLRDAPIAEWDYRHEIYWKPANPQARYRGLVIAHDALVSSLNAPAVDVLDRLGYTRFADKLKKFGISSKIAHVRPTALGASCVKPFELIAAFTSFSNGGHRSPGQANAKVLVDGSPLWDGSHPYDPFLRPSSRIARLASSHRPPSVLTAEQAFIIWNMLRDVVKRGTGRRAAFSKRNVGGKTGTTNDNTDAWFVGFAGRYTAGLWVGFDNPAHKLGPGRDGGRYAAPLWRKLTRSLPLGPSTAPPTAPEGLVYHKIDPSTGRILKAGGRKLPFEAENAPLERAETNIEQVAPSDVWSEGRRF